MEPLDYKLFKKENNLLLSICPKSTITIKNSLDRIVKVIIDNRLIISEDSIIDIEGDEFIVGSIIQNGQLILLQRKLNKSLMFVVPLLSLSIDDIGLENYLLNSYLFYDEEDFKEPGEYVYLHYQFKNEPEFKKLESSLKTFINYESTIDLDKDILVKFKIDPLYYYTICNIILGKYSQLKHSREYMTKICNFFKGDFRASYEDLKSIINKEGIDDIAHKLAVSKELLQEVRSEPNLINETWKMRKGYPV